MKAIDHPRLRRLAAKGALKIVRRGGSLMRRARNSGGEQGAMGSVSLPMVSMGMGDSGGVNTQADLNWAGEGGWQGQPAIGMPDLLPSVDDSGGYGHALRGGFIGLNPAGRAFNAPEVPEALGGYSRVAGNVPVPRGGFGMVQGTNALGTGGYVGHCPHCGAAPGSHCNHRGGYLGLNPAGRAYNAPEVPEALGGYSRMLSGNVPMRAYGGYDSSDPLGNAVQAGHEYLKGGVPSMLTSMGYRVPDWVNTVGRVVRNPDLNAALGTIGPEFDTPVYHATGADFKEFKPSAYRGATFFSSTPEGAMKGASAGARDMTGSGSTSIIPASVPSEGIRGLSLTPSQKQWWNKLPETLKEIEVDRHMQDMPKDFRGWYDIYDEKQNPDGSFVYNKKPMPKISLDQAEKTGRDVYGQQISHYYSGGEKNTAKRVLSEGMHGWIQQDEGGVSVGIADPSKIKPRYRGGAGGYTPKDFWTYQPDSPTPGGPPGVSPDDWESLSPGMRREIIRQQQKPKPTSTNGGGGYNRMLAGNVPMPRGAYSQPDVSQTMAVHALRRMMGR